MYSQVEDKLRVSNRKRAELGGQVPQGRLWSADEIGDHKKRHHKLVCKGTINKPGGIVYCTYTRTY